MVAVVGPSGSGKTTLLSILGAFTAPTEGLVERRPGLEIAYVFQRAVVLGRRSVLDNVAIAILARGQTRRDADIAAMDALATVHLSELALRRADTLSGGQLQRVAVARATVSKPGLILADEPTAGLDGAAVVTTVAALRAACGGAGVVVATHDMEVVRGCDRVITLR